MNDGNETLSLNISLQSNLDSDIIQIKKPFYGNVLSVEIDKKDLRITNLNKMNYPQEDIIYLDLNFEEASKFIVSAGTSNPT